MFLIDRIQKKLKKKKKKKAKVNKNETTNYKIVFSDSTVSATSVGQ